MKKSLIAILIAIPPLSITTASLANDPTGLAPSKDQIEGSTKKGNYSPYAGRDFPTRPLWGDTHLHTDLSLDARAFGVTIGLDSAYRFARGEEVIATHGEPVKLSRPLDFLVVADHSDAMGAMRDIFKGNPELLADPTVRRWYRDLQKGGRSANDAVIEIVNGMTQGSLPEVLVSQNFMRTVWDENLKFTEQYNEPGRFTATTGSRMTIRFFGGWDFDAVDAANRLPAEVGYAKGVPMGGNLSKAPKGKAPTFLVGALRDPLSGNLDRIQIIKGWLDSKGKTHEKVYEVVWSGDRQPASDGKLPSVGNTVDVKNATWVNTIGAPELITVWTDPDFDAEQRAFYYARVMEIPTPRWIAYDVKHFDAKLPKEVPMITTERGYTSPIWYTP